MRIEPSGWPQVEKRDNNNPAVYQSRPQQKLIPAPIYVAMHAMVSTGGFIGKQSQSPLSSPIVHQQTPSHGATSPASPGFLFSYTAGQLLDRSVKVETRGHLTKAGVFGKHTIIDNERSNVNKVANHDLIWKKRSMLMHSGVLYPKETTKPSRVVPGTSQYASGLYIGRYPVDDDPQVYQHRNQQVYPRGYTTDYVSPKTYILSDSSKTSNQQKVGTVFSPFKQIKEDTFERVVCDSTNNGLSTSASDTAEEKRRLALKHLLIRPITQMKGEAWNDIEWRDYSTFHSFHDAVTDFLRIIELTKDKKMAAEIKEFLGSELLVPRYIAQHQPSVPAKKLNHFHVFWNLMHQLPFAVKKWDGATAMKLKLFYEVWVTTTLQCGYCRGHYQTWITASPPTVTDRSSLNKWLLRLHNDVNQRTSKPQFEWSRYNERWGINHHARAKAPKASSTKNSSPKKSNRSIYSTPKKTSTSRYSPVQTSGQSRTGSYWSISKTSTSRGSPYRNADVSITPEALSSSSQQEKLAVGNQDSRPPYTRKTKTQNFEESSANLDAKVREITGLHIDEEPATIKESKWKQQPRLVGLTPMDPEPSLPRRCLLRKNLVARRNRANKRSGPFLPRKRVSGKGKSEPGGSIMKAIRSFSFNRKKTCT